MADQPAVEASASASAIPAANTPPVPEVVPDFRKAKHKLKVNDKEHELDYDTVLKLAQKGMGADELFRSASAKEKKIAALFDRAKSGDLDWLQDIAGDDKLTKWAEKKLLKIIERQNMSPDQLALHEERSRREALEDEKKTRDERDTEERTSHLRQAAAEDLDEQITTAFKTTGLPMTPSRLERVAQYMDASLNATGTLMDAGKALARVQTEIRSDAKELLESMKPEDIREFLPKKVLDAIRKADIEDVRSQDPMRRTTQNGQQPPRRISDAKQKRMSTDTFFNNLEKKLGG